VWFAAICLAWLAAYARWPDVPAVGAPALAWFTTWGIQVAVVMTYWARPFALPDRYYGALVVRRARRRRMIRLRRFGRVATRINPLTADIRRVSELRAAMRSAETTHAVSLVLVGGAMLAAIAEDADAFAMCLLLWNVLFNLYPVVLQRQNRARLEAVAPRLAGTAAG
jgi:hypothetical protein